MLTRLLRGMAPRQGAANLRSTIKQTSSRRQFSNYDFDHRVFNGARAGSATVDIGLTLGILGGGAYGLSQGRAKIKNDKVADDVDVVFTETAKGLVAGLAAGAAASTAAATVVALPEVVLPSALFYASYRALKNNSKKEEPQNSPQNTLPSPKPKA